MKFIIDEELRALIPPLSKEEFEQLEKNILEFGCLDPLKVWPVPDNEEPILLDGHNRFSICSRHNVSYNTESISLVDRVAAIDWMILNQLGRRNLSVEQVLYLRGIQYLQERQEITNPDGIGGKSGKTVVDHFDPHHESTAARLAKQHGVSEGTIKRGAKYAEAVDAIANATSPEVRQQILSNECKLTQAATLKLAKLAQNDPAEVLVALEEVRQTSNKTAASAVVQRYISKIDKTPVNKQTVQLINFKNATDAINWLKGKFTVTELAESLAQQMAKKKADEPNL